MAMAMLGWNRCRQAARGRRPRQNAPQVIFLGVPLRYRYNAHLRTRKRYIMVLSVTVTTTIFIELCTILDKIHYIFGQKTVF